MKKSENHCTLLYYSLRYPPSLHANVRLPAATRAQEPVAERNIRLLCCLNAPRLCQQCSCHVFLEPSCHPLSLIAPTSPICHHPLPVRQRLNNVLLRVPLYPVNHPNNVLCHVYSAAGGHVPRGHQNEAHLSLR